MPLNPGVRLGPYEIIARIGAGGMGEVYKARDSRLERTVAIKVIESSVSADPMMTHRLLREARTASALNHPHICTIHDVGADSTPQFIAMEWLDGETLRERLERAMRSGQPAMPFDETLKFASQIADALEAAHGGGIIHRDLKPANLFITKRGDAKILDFGLAKVMAEMGSGATVAADRPLTDAGSAVGTIAYMAPEQARGERVDARSDLFALGVVLYEMVTGRMAFAGATTALTFDAILNRQPPRLRDSNPGVPASLDAIIWRLLQKDPSARYQDARELLADLERARRGEEVKSGVHKAAPSVAVMPFVNMSTDPENQFFCDGLAEELINALTRLPGLHVASRTSAFRFRTGDADIRRIGQELKVGAVVEGSVRRASNRLRVTAQLINVADGYHLWSDRYDREMADVFDIQDDIVAAIVQALAPALLGDAKHAVHRPTENLEAYELYLKGRHYWHHRTPGMLQHAVRCFEHVIALDPNYALAYAGLADCYSIFRVYGWFPLEATQPRVREAVDRAMAIDPTLAEVHYSQALYVFFFETNWHDAAAHLKQAIAINPRGALSHAQLAIVLAAGRQFDDAAAEADVARQLDPLSPIVHFMSAASFNIAAKFDLGERAASRALELQPDLPTGLWTRGIALTGLERHDEAIAVGERLVTLSRAPIFVGELGLIYSRAGRVEAANRLLDELDEREARGEYVAPFARLETHVGLGDIDAVRKDLEACLRDRPGSLAIKSTCGPWLDALRTDPAINRMLDALYSPTKAASRASG